MTTKKLFYQNQYMRTFTAKVLNSYKDDNGHFYAVLHQTSFYPTGGGQPHDTGTLNGVHVFDVVEIDGEIRHYIEEPVESHHKIVGEINWERRFDHMQQHAGQHILSAAFEDVIGYKTVSFHLGKEICSIDLETADLTNEETNLAEEKANEIILQNRPIETKWVTKDELSNYTLRKELSVSDDIRLVVIPAFDYNGCGGTHPDSTGQVSSIKILHWEKQKKKTRVYFVCGNRVLKQLGEKHKVIQGLTDQLNAPQEDLNKMAKRTLRLTKHLENNIQELKTELISYETDRLINQAEIHQGYNITKAIFQNRQMSDIQQLAKLITAKTDNLLGFLINETDEKLQFVCAKNEDLDLNMNDIVKSVLPAINGKGGGNHLIAQGGGERTISPDELMDELINIL
ncbi:alanyl-tRNA editing protein [Virgibacillus doumboii]|uniref:alanyl-tRNA editing protein n=1 Tax=Virgibacillus doumboii TaxID=2697503 RepID=UPI001FE48A53|nr:DHHA1 domain-containing protein [Virgibacillus doumboii]